MTSCEGVSGTPAAAKASTKTRAEGSDSAQAVNFDSAAVDALYPTWVTARNTVATANRTYVNADALVTTDITKKIQRIQQDETIVLQNEYGSGCIASAISTDVSTYEGCVQSEEQTASAAQSDSDTANAEIQTDYQQYTTTDSTYESALSAFLSQIADIDWPAPMGSVVTNLVRATESLRTDVSDQATGTSDASGQGQAGIDLGSFNEAIGAVNAVFVHLGASLPTT